MDKFVFKTALVLATCAGLVACNTGDKQNEPPKLISTSFVTETDVVIMDTLVAKDPENDRLSFALVSPADSGSVSVQSNGQFVYTPASEFTGDDSFGIEITDGSNVVQASVSIDVRVAIVSFLNYSRAAFAIDADGTPLPLNGREFTMDVMSEADYADLLNGI